MAAGGGGGCILESNTFPRLSLRDTLATYGYKRVRIPGRTCNPSRAVTVPNIGVSHYIGVPHLPIKRAGYEWFGFSKFKALFEAIERQQEERHGGVRDLLPG